MSNTRSPLLRSRMRLVNEAVARGDTVAEGLALTGDYFPALLREVVDVGEHTGHLAEVFKHLAEHYEEQLRLKRAFTSSIAWPCIQLTLSLIVVGIMILVSGAIGAMGGRGPTDILGLGLVGPSGFIIYCLTLATIAVGAFLFIQAARRGLAWTEPVQKLVLALPGVGQPLRTIALAQMAWTMELTLEAGMDLLKAIPLSLRSTHNAYYTQHTDQMMRTIRAGHEINEALAESGAFSLRISHRRRGGRAQRPIARGDEESRPRVSRGAPPRRANPDGHGRLGRMGGDGPGDRRHYLQDGHANVRSLRADDQRAGEVARGCPPAGDEGCNSAAQGLLVAAFGQFADVAQRVFHIRGGYAYLAPLAIALREQHELVKAFGFFQPAPRTHAQRPIAHRLLQNGVQSTRMCAA